VRELAAIGEVTVQWVYLEHQVLELARELTEVLGEPSSDEAAHFSFDRRLRYLKTLLKSPAFTNEQGKQKYLDPDQSKPARTAPSPFFIIRR
jgi:hypothetical protein